MIYLPKPMPMLSALAALVGLALLPLLPAQEGGVSRPATQPADTQQEPDPRPVNRLAKESSPYLRQHQHNPVDWYPWGDEAFAAAKAQDKPIFLSVGYAACHWCHVMERESFEDEEIAALMNQHFINVKVDREERPDVDEIYMAAVQAMTGRGGWPMSVFMTPDGKPFFGGTYFPPRDARGQPGFKRVLETLAQAWRERREDVLKDAGNAADYLKRALAPTTPPGEPTADLFTAATKASVENADPVHGGFAPAAQGYAPKFPHAQELGMLLRNHAMSGEAVALQTAEAALGAMADGGIHDQLGGGFHRYSVDREWLVPHFEKMLYDNAQLARTYTDAWLHTGEARWQRVARSTLDYLLREMQHPLGGFYSSQDADSEGVEGRFFVWSKGELEAALGADARIAALHWGVSDPPNWEAGNVLHVAMPVARVAKELGQEEADVAAAIDRSRAALLALRGQRIRPGTDDKVLASWNGLAITALSLAHQAYGEARYLAAAQRCAGFVLDRMYKDGRLLRSWRDVEGDGMAPARLTGVLEDYAFLAEGLLHLFESDGDPRWLRGAQALLETVLEKFRDAASGSFFQTGSDHEELLTRVKSVFESSTPSGVGVAASSLLRAGLMLGNEDWYGAGADALRAHHQQLVGFPSGVPTLVNGCHLLLGDPVEVVVSGSPGSEGYEALLEAAWRRFPRDRVVLPFHPANQSELKALTDVVMGKDPADTARAFVCRRGACKEPTSDPAALFR